MATASSVRGKTFQPLVECRLDLLDRLLFGVVPPTERMELLVRTRERIDELLGALPSAEPSREEVLEVLSRLDPPEALLPAHHFDAAGAGPSGLAWGAGLALPLPRPILKSAKVACGLGLASVLVLLFLPFAYVGMSYFGMLAGEVAAYALVGAYLLAMLGTAVSAIVCAFVALWRLRKWRGTYSGHLWATLGLVTALIPFGLACLTGVLLVVNWGEL